MFAPVRSLRPWLNAILCLSSISLFVTCPTVTAETTQDGVPLFSPELLKVGLYGEVIAKARKLAATPYQKPEQNLPDVLKHLDYDQYRSIRFQPQNAVWKDQGAFEIQLFHPGFLFQEPVAIHEVMENRVSPLAFRPDFFNYEGPAAHITGKVPVETGFAGFRVHYPLNNKTYKDEFLVFQGASYFRLVGPGHAYGLSARGLALDTAEAKGEEFPIFREFWLEKPAADSHELIIYALLDSQSITGAYRFVVRPGIPTEMDVWAEVFARTDVGKLGVAPLTSMFMWGENRTRFYDDFRPEVHDNDGLLMAASNGEWIWRPLSNHRHLHVSSLMDSNPKGFGLVQRDRNFDHYLDMESRYEQRPSLWITPLNNWGKGRVELVEIPSDSETNDNIVAYWVPETRLKAGESRSFQYNLRTFDAFLPNTPHAHVLRTHIGWGGNPAQPNPPPKDHRRFVVDFQGGGLEQLGADAAVIPELQIIGGSLRDTQVQRLPDGKTWRVTFTLSPEANQPADMRLFLRLGDRRISEVWSYVWYADALE
jgi:periplasmic glucans biosynthesis protein